MVLILRLMATAFFLQGGVMCGGVPNVLVLVADDLGVGDLGSGGNPWVKTPAMDRLLGEGVEFRRLVGAPSGAAGRAQLWSGCHEFRCGVSAGGSGRNLVRPGVALWPEVFRQAGYRTALIGRWGLGEVLPCRPEDRGFEDVAAFGGNAPGHLADRWGNGVNDPWVRTREGWVARTGRATRVGVDEARRWLQAREAGKSFFLAVALQAPHAPYEAGAGAALRFRQAGLEEPAASFHALIEELDAGVGELLGELDRLGLSGDTVVVFAGDNGSAMGTWNAGLRGIKGSVDEGGVRVPGGIRWPGKIPPRRVESLVSLMDVLPTVAGLCGVKAGVEGVDGVDLSDAVRGVGGYPEGRILCSHVGGWPGDDRPERHRSVGFAVRDGRWVLSGLELYQIEADPGQRRNVFEAHPDEATRLLGAYGAWWSRVQGVVREPVRMRVGDERQPVVRLSAADWWPSGEVLGAVGAEGWVTQAAARRTLGALAAGQAVPETAGHWKLEVARDGHYRLRLSLVPAEAPAGDRTRLGQLRAGKVHVRTGKRELQMEVARGATSVTLRMDLAAGPVDLEAWFSGQLAGGRVFGAPFAEVAREGERRRPDLDLEIRTVPKKE